MTAAGSDDILATKRRELLSLDTQKKALQSEAEAIVSEITSELPGGVSLIDLMDGCFDINKVE